MNWSKDQLAFIVTELSQDMFLLPVCLSALIDWYIFFYVFIYLSVSVSRSVSICLCFYYPRANEQGNVMCVQKKNCNLSELGT